MKTGVVPGAVGGERRKPPTARPGGLTYCALAGTILGSTMKIVPYRTRLLRDINGVSTRMLQPPTYQEPARPDGLDAHTITPELVGVLILSGGNDTLELNVSPTDLDRTESRVSRFLASSDRRLRLWLVSNWKAAVVAQSVVILPALLILLGLAWDVAALAMSVSRPE
jgi:hypothetical protein